MSFVKLTSLFLVSSDSTLRRNLMSSGEEVGIITDGWFEFIRDSNAESSSTVDVTGLETADPTPSTPLLTDGVFSESLHSSSSPGKRQKTVVSFFINN